MTEPRDLSELDRQIDQAETFMLDPNGPGRRWNQGTWIAPCGTYGCIAGNTVLDAGYRCLYGGYIAEADGGGFVPEVARQLLGLTGPEASAIFSGWNTIGVLRRLQKDLHDGREINLGLAVTYQDEEHEMPPRPVRLTDTWPW